MTARLPGVKGFYQLGNELRPEHIYTFGVLEIGFYQLGNELRPEHVYVVPGRRTDFIS